MCVLLAGKQRLNRLQTYAFRPRFRADLAAKPQNLALLAERVLSAN